MTLKLTPQTTFETAVHEAYQFTQAQRFTRFRLLVSFTDARHEAVAWYTFSESLLSTAESRAYDDILMKRSPKAIGPIRADKTDQFAGGVIDSATIHLKHPRTVDHFGSIEPRKPKDPVLPNTTARLVNSKFVALGKKAVGSDLPATERLELTMHYHLYTGTEREIIAADVALLGVGRPSANLFAVAGFLQLLGVQPFAKAQGGLREDFRNVLLNPI